MNPNLDVRLERSTDHEAIRQIHQLAFGSNAEADLVDALREQGFARVSLVAETDGQVVGHILFSDLRIVSSTGTVRALALAPLAVLPQRQRQGIGSQLIQVGCDQCRQAGHRIVIVVGDPDYYARFGFSAQAATMLQSKYAGEAFMALELVPGALKDVVGQVCYAAPFDAF
jgi:putative acetyltransferase